MDYEIDSRMFAQNIDRICQLTYDLIRNNIRLINNSKQGGQQFQMKNKKNKWVDINDGSSAIIKTALNDVLKRYFGSGLKEMTMSQYNDFYNNLIRQFNRSNIMHNRMWCEEF